MRGTDLVKVYELVLSFADGELHQNVFDGIDVNGSVYKIKELCAVGKCNFFVLNKNHFCLDSADFKWMIADRICALIGSAEKTDDLRWYFLDESVMRDFIEVYEKNHKKWIAETMLMDLHKTVMRMNENIKQIKEIRDAHMIHLDQVDQDSENDFFEDAMTTYRMIDFYNDSFIEGVD